MFPKPLAYYPLDKNAVDVVNKYNGTSTAISHVKGYSHGAALFNGTTSKIQLPSGLPRTPTYWTVCCWIYNKKVVNATYEPTIYQDWGNTFKNIRWSFYYSSRKLRLLIGNGASNQDAELLSTTVLKQNQWYHVAVVCNSTYHAIYVNGKLDNSATGSYSGGTSTSATRYIGLDNYATASCFWDGYIEDFYLFNRALSHQQINLIYQMYKNLPRYKFNFMDIIAPPVTNSNFFTFFN